MCVGVCERGRHESPIFKHPGGTFYIFFFKCYLLSFDSLSVSQLAADRLCEDECGFFFFCVRWL